MTSAPEPHRTLHAAPRPAGPRGANRRLRAAGKMPAIVYGNGVEPLPIAVDHQAMVKLLEDERNYTRVLRIALDGGGVEEAVILKSLQRHPSRPRLLHADFLRVDMGRKVTVRVPLHFVNEESAPGVRLEGGIASKLITDLEVRCLPGVTPERIDVDLSGLHVGNTLHISDLELPDGVESVALSHGEGHDLPVTNILQPKGAAADAAEETEEASEGPAPEGAGAGAPES